MLKLLKEAILRELEANPQATFKEDKAVKALQKLGIVSREPSLDDNKLKGFKMVSKKGKKIAEFRVLRKEPLLFLSPEEITNLAKEFIKKAQEGKILEAYSYMLLPWEDGKGYKELLITEIFRLLGFKAEYIKKVGLVVSVASDSKTSQKKVYMSHGDLIPSFQKACKLERGNKLTINGKGDKCEISGVLDNTITNAALIIAFIQQADKIHSQNIDFVFTEGEEIGLLGATAYMKKLHNEGNFYINLDVTNEAWKKSVSIEYDKPDYNVCQAFKNNPDKIALGFTHNRECDDLDAVMSGGGIGFSCCLPTDGIIHSFENTTTLKKFREYVSFLGWTMREFEVPQESLIIPASVLGGGWYGESHLEEVLEKSWEEVQALKKSKKESSRNRNNAHLFNSYHGFGANDDWMFEDEDSNFTSVLRATQTSDIQEAILRGIMDVLREVYDYSEALVAEEGFSEDNIIDAIDETMSEDEEYSLNPIRVLDIIQEVLTLIGADYLLDFSEDIFKKVRYYLMF
jgi:hypothetical protein